MNTGQKKYTDIPTVHLYYTCDKQVLWESAGAFFPCDNSRQVAHFTLSWSSGKMLAFQPRDTRGYALIFFIYLEVFRSRRFSLFSAL